MISWKFPSTTLSAKQVDSLSLTWSNWSRDQATTNQWVYCTFCAHTRLFQTASFRHWFHSTVAHLNPHYNRSRHCRQQCERVGDFACNFAFWALWPLDGAGVLSGGWVGTLTGVSLSCPGRQSCTVNRAQSPGVLVRPLIQLFGWHDNASIIPLEWISVNFHISHLEGRNKVDFQQQLIR